jgi:glycerol-3-phosphate cytidylyltransferase-like family protein
VRRSVVTAVYYVERVMVEKNENIEMKPNVHLTMNFIRLIDVSDDLH